VNCGGIGPVDIPPGVVTVTGTLPGEPAGLIAVIVVLLRTVTLVAGFRPKLTAMAPVRLVPVIVTSVPPPKGPATGLIAETVGASTYVN
jgi:hypothetical protein